MGKVKHIYIKDGYITSCRTFSSFRRSRRDVSCQLIPSHPRLSSPRYHLQTSAKKSVSAPNSPRPAPSFLNVHEKPLPTLPPLTHALSTSVLDAHHHASVRPSSWMHGHSHGKHPLPVVTPLQRGFSQTSLLLFTTRHFPSNSFPCPN